MEFLLVKLQTYIVQTVALRYTVPTLPHILLQHVPKISCLKKNILRKKPMVYLRLNKVTILPKRELTLDLVEEELKILVYLLGNLFGANFFR